MRVTDPPTAMVMEDEGERRMEADSIFTCYYGIISLGLVPGTCGLLESTFTFQSC